MASEKRWAFLIGQQKYEEASGVKPLDYCHADIQQVKWALENLCGFKVVIFEDACKSDFQTLQKLVIQNMPCTPDAVVLIYYAGHGCCMGGQVHWIPVDGREGEASTYLNVYEFLRPIHDRLARYEARLLCIHDCCRSFQELSNSSEKQQLGQRLSNKVLASKEPQLCLVFACDEGSEAEEVKDQQHGRFTAAFLKGLEQEGLSWYDLMETTREFCIKFSRRRQRSWWNSTATNLSKLILHPKGSFSTGYFARTLASETGVSGCASVNLNLHGIAADLHGLVKRSTDLETCPQAARYAHEVREHVQRMLGEETLPPSPDLLNTCWLVKTIACMLPATYRKQLLFLATKLQLRGFLEASEVSTAVVGEAISAACHALQSEGIDSTFLAKDALREEDIIQHLKSLTEEKLNSSCNQVDQRYTNAAAAEQNAMELQQDISNELTTCLAKWQGDAEGSAVKVCEEQIMVYTTTVAEELVTCSTDRAVTEDQALEQLIAISGDAELAQAWKDNINICTSQSFNGTQSLCFHSQKNAESFKDAFCNFICKTALRDLQEEQAVKRTLASAQIPGKKRKWLGERLHGYNSSSENGDNLPPLCPAGHILTPFQATSPQACGLCETSQKVGETLHGCDFCNYEVCQACSWTLQCKSPFQFSSTSSHLPEKAMERALKHEDLRYIKYFGRAALSGVAVATTAATAAASAPLFAFVGTVSAAASGIGFAAAASEKGTRYAQDMFKTVKSTVVGETGAHLTLEELRKICEEQVKLVRAEWLKRQKADILEEFDLATQVLVARAEEAHRQLEVCQGDRKLLHALRHALLSLKIMEGPGPKIEE